MKGNPYRPSKSNSPFLPRGQHLFSSQKVSKAQYCISSPKSTNANEANASRELPERLVINKRWSFLATACLSSALRVKGAPRGIVGLIVLPGGTAQLFSLFPREKKTSNPFSTVYGGLLEKKKKLHKTFLQSFVLGTAFVSVSL